MDEDLVARAQQGDRRAFESLVLGHYSRLYRVAKSILRDPHTAEDATQQAFLDIWRHIPRLKEPSRFGAWSYRLLVNACYDEARRNPGWLPETAVAPSVEPRARDASTAVIARDELERALGRLSLEHRSVVVLRYLMDLSPEEIGEVLGIPRGTVYSRLKRALRSIRGVLEADARQADPARMHQEVVR